MEGHTLINDKLKQCILEMLRMGEDPDKIQRALAYAYEDVGKAKTYEGQNQVAEFAKAIKDSDFRP
jgi:replication-associated recombination protein RarA